MYVLNTTPSVFPKNGTAQGVGPVWFVPFDGSKARRVTERASAVLFAVDGAGRAMTAVGINSDDLGALLVIDLDSGEARQVDDRAFVEYLDVTGAFESEEIMYSVVDGERSGVWVARPAR